MSTNTPADLQRALDQLAAQTRQLRQQTRALSSATRKDPR
jgi:hypothetical protein